MSPAVAEMMPWEYMLRRPPHGIPVAMWAHVKWLRQLFRWSLLLEAVALCSASRWGTVWYAALAAAVSEPWFVQTLIRREIRQFEDGVRTDDYARCLECGYLLRDLPPKHSCPECGIAYNLDAVRRSWAVCFGDVPEEDDAGTGDDSDLTTWTCPKCHEETPGNFEICWHCRSPRSEANDGEDFSKQAGT